MTPNTTLRRRGSIWRTLRAVGWGFFGVRQHSAFQEDAVKLTPLTVIAIGFVGVLLLVAGLVALIRFVVMPAVA